MPRPAPPPGMRRRSRTLEGIRYRVQTQQLVVGATVAAVHLPKRHGDGAVINSHGIAAGVPRLTTNSGAARELESSRYSHVSPTARSRARCAGTIGGGSAVDVPRRRRPLRRRFQRRPRPRCGPQTCAGQRRAPATCDVASSGIASRRPAARRRRRVRLRPPTSAARNHLPSARRSQSPSFSTILA